MSKCDNHGSLFCSIGRARRSISILLEHEFEKNNINIKLPHFIILNILNHRKDTILEDLSKILHTDKSAIMRHVNHLEKLHFVAKLVTENDKRCKVLMLTQKGMEILESTRAIERKLQNKLTKDISIKALENITMILASIQNEASSYLTKV